MADRQHRGRPDGRLLDLYAIRRLTRTAPRMVLKGVRSCRAYHFLKNSPILDRRKIDGECSSNRMISLGIPRRNSHIPFS